jgi:hypothetical protein
MQVGELNIGDLVRFNYSHRDVESDMGIILDITSTDVMVHWRDEDDRVLFHEEDEVNDWLTRGMFEVLSANR